MMFQVKENVQPILPPPPSSRRGHFERQQTVQPTSTSSSSSPITTVTSKTPPPYGSVHWFDKETEDLFNDGELSNLSKNLTGDKDKDSVSISLKISKIYLLRVLENKYLKEIIIVSGF